MKWLARKKRKRNYIQNGVGVLESPSGVKFYIDADDFERCKRILWMVNGNGYAYNEAEGYLHRFIMGCCGVVERYALQRGAVWEVDHIDRDKQNCRKENLRVVTHRENCQNRETLGRVEKYSEGRTF